MIKNARKCRLYSKLMIYTNTAGAIIMCRKTHLYSSSAITCNGYTDTHNTHVSLICFARARSHTNYHQRTIYICQVLTLRYQKSLSIAHRFTHHFQFVKRIYQNNNNDFGTRAEWADILQWWHRITFFSLPLSLSNSIKKTVHTRQAHGKYISMLDNMAKCGFIKSDREKQ